MVTASSTALEVRLLDIAYGTSDWQLKWPYGSLPRVSIATDESDTLREVVFSAASMLATDRRLSFDPRSRDPIWIAYYTPELEYDALEQGLSQGGAQLYGVRPDGTLVVANDGLSNVTWGDVRRAGPHGYRAGDPSRWLIVPPEGLGALEFSVQVDDWVAFLGTLGVLFESARGVRGASTWSRRRLQAWRDRSARAVAESWRERGIEGPHELEAWISVKSTWAPEEISVRLGIPVSSAAELLRALGYEEDSRRGAWVQSDSRAAQARRRQWHRARKRFYTSEAGRGRGGDGR